MPDLSLERRESGLLVGIDEAGRGPWAGPVTAAAVVLNLDAVPPGLDDSKKLSPARRAALAEAIRADHRFGLGWASVAEIDAHNILAASHLAMRRALDALGAPAPAVALVDGNRDPGLGLPTRLVIGGDGLSLSIAAASILAKVARDAAMVELDHAHPGYGFALHKGYGTAAHAEALRRLGVSPAHRRSFQPIHKMLCE